MITKAVLPLLYIAPVQYYSKFFLYKEILIQQHENYNKQSFRNRGSIYSANGKLALSIPIEKGRTPQLKYKTIAVSYVENWQKNHIRAIESAYRHTPFFEFYWDDYLPLYQTQFETLWELNLAFHKLVLRDIGLSPKVFFNDAFEVESADNYSFLANAKGNKLADIYFEPKEYYQVFSEKTGFLQNLSILDLIFNEGPNAYAILKASIVNI